MKFLESAGARVVPVNYRLKPSQLQKVLSQLNGLYIPGDDSNILANDKYMAAIALILDWA